MLVAPAASCAVKKAHELETTGSTGATRPSLRDGVNGCFVLSLVCRPEYRAC